MLVCIASLDQREAVMRKQETETNASACSRRNLLLGSTTLAAVSALVSVLPFDEVAQAQTQQASSGKSRMFSSSLVTTSGIGTSVLTIAA
jgi:hypothetical protein